MYITVNEALKLPELSMVNLVAGKAGGERKITSINVMEVPDISGFVKEGDLLVTTMYPIRNQEKLQRELVPMLQDKGVAALAIAPLEMDKSIPDFMVQQAESLDFPLLALPYATAFNSIINPILQNIVDRQTSLLKKNAEVNQRFINLLIKGGSLTEIAGMIHGEGDIPVAICSPLGNVMASAGEIDEGCIAHFAENGLLSQGGLLQLEGASELPAQVWSYPIHYVGEHYATVFLIFPGTDLQRNQPEQEMVEQAANIIALEIARIRNQHTLEQRQRASLMENLLQGKVGSLPQAIRMGKGCGWDLSGAFLPVVIRAREGEGQAETKEDVFFTLQKSLDERILRRLHHGAITVSISNETLALFPVSVSDSGGQLSRIQAFITDFVGGFTRLVWVGIGRVAEDILHLPLAVAQAEKAAAIAGLSAGKKQVLSYDELGVFRVLSDRDSHGEQLLFLRETLGGVLAQKADYRDELLRTLEVYFASGCNLRQTAKELFMHYNTISYRVRRIEELLGQNLADPETRLSMQVALKLLDLLQG